MRRLRTGVLLAIVGTGLAMRGSVADEPAKATPPPKPARVEDFAPASEFVQVGNVKTHVVRKGDTGPSVVLIHGFGSSTYTWRLNTDELAKTCRVFAIDIKGFGLTEKPRDGRYYLAEYVDHLVSTLDVLKIDRAILVGNSMGGAISARLALLHPERVAGLVLVDAAPPNWTPPALGREEKAPAEKKPVPPSLTDRFKVALAKTLITRKAVEAGLRSAYYDPKIVTDEMVDAYFNPYKIEGAPEALIAMTNPPKDAGRPTPPLEELKAPALIIWGRHDRIIPLTAISIFTKALPKARKVIFDKSGHLPHEEEPELFNRLVAEFAASPR